MTLYSKIDSTIKVSVSVKTTFTKYDITRINIRCLYISMIIEIYILNFIY